MNKILKILVSLLILTFPSFSQNVTESDSLICLPSSVLKKAIADIKKSDYLEEEVILLGEDTSNLKSIILYKDSQIVTLEKKQFNLRKQVNSYKDIDSLQTDNINLLKKEVKKQKNTKKIMGVGGIILIILSILFV